MQKSREKKLSESNTHKQSCFNEKNKVSLGGNLYPYGENHNEGQVALWEGV